MKLKYWFGFGFGLDKRLNRHSIEEIYIVIPFLKVRVSLNKEQQLLKKYHY